MNRDAVYPEAASVPAKRSRMFRNGWPYVFIFPFFASYLVFNFYPVLYTFYLSLTSWDGMGDKTFVGFRNYAKLFTTDPYFYKSIGNTMIVMLGFIPAQIMAALVLAAMINSKLTRWQLFNQTAVFLPYITTPVAIGLIVSILFDWKTGTVNRLLIDLGVLKDAVYWLGEPATARIVVMGMLFWKYLGYVTVLFLAGLANISKDYYEAAEIDGAGAVQRFVRITLPLLRPIILFVTITGIGGGLQLFDEIFMLFSGLFASGSAAPGGPSYSLLTAVWNMYDTAFGSTLRYGYASAIAYGLFLFIIVFTLLTYKLSNRRDDL